MTRNEKSEIRGLDVLSASPLVGDEMLAAEAAKLIVFHRAGSLPPLVMIRTWHTEIEQHRLLATHLGGDQPIYSIAPPSGNDPAAYPDYIAGWCDHAEKEFLALDLPDPIRIGGWSFGGVVAFEMAERALDRGRQVSIVLLHDSCLPKSDPTRRPGKKIRDRLGRLGGHLLAYSELRDAQERRHYLLHPLKRNFKRARRWVTGALPSSAPQIDDETDFEGLLNEAMWTTSTGERISFLRRAVQVSYVRYRPQTGRVPVALLTTVETRKRFDRDLTLGWWKCLQGEFDAAPVPGGHRSMYEEPHIKILAEETRRMLARTQGRVTVLPADGN